MSKLMDSSGLSHLVSWIKEQLGLKVNKTTKINNKALSSDVTLTASDVGALPNTTALLQLGEVTGTAYDGAKGKSVRDDLDTHIASNVRHITENERTVWNAKQTAITESNKLPYALVSGTPTIPTVPTKLSEFTDDLGSSPTHTHSQYLTSHQDISGKQDKIKSIPQNTDLNTLTTPGYYYCSANVTAMTLSNTPTGNAFFMEVGNHAGVYQRVTEYKTSGFKVFHRNRYTTWGDWIELKLTDSDTTYSAGTGLALSGTTFSLNMPRVYKDSKSIPGTNKVIFEEYVAGVNYNLPTNHFYHIMTMEGQDTNYATQLALGMTTNGAYYRFYHNQVWEDWKKLAYTTDIPDISGKADKATTLAGYGITDAKIVNGVITLGDNTIMPVTQTDIDDSHSFTKQTGFEIEAETAEGGVRIDEVDGYSAVVAGQIKSVGTIIDGKPYCVINAKSKNLFDYSNWLEQWRTINNCTAARGTVELIENGFKLTATGDDAFTSTYGANGVKIYVKPNTTYTISFDVSGDTGLSYVFLNGSTASGYMFDFLGSRRTFTTLSDTSYINIRFGIYNTGGTRTIKNIQIEESSTSTAYVPYAISTSTIPLTAPLRAIGDLKDKLTYRDGKWYESRVIGSVDIGTLNYSYSPSNTIFFTDSVACKVQNNNLLSAIYETHNYADSISAMTNMQVKLNASGTPLNRIFIKNTSYTDVSAFKSAMTGQELIYELETPTLTECLDQAAFYNLNAYEGMTYVASEDGFAEMHLTTSKYDDGSTALLADNEGKKALADTEKAKAKALADTPQIHVTQNATLEETNTYPYRTTDEYISIEINTDIGYATYYLNVSDIVVIPYQDEIATASDNVAHLTITDSTINVSINGVVNDAQIKVTTWRSLN